MLAINAASSTSGLKTLWQADGDSWSEPVVPDVEEEEYDYLDEEYDQGADTDNEDVFWVSPDLLQQPLEEQNLDWTFATFAEVQRQKQWFRKSRGFDSKGKGKGKGKGKEHGGKDYSGYPSWKGKGKGKSFGHGDNFQRFQQRRQERDGRRFQKGFVKTTREQLVQRSRCWRCQQIGHLAAQCPNPAASSSGGGK
eukprot:6479583-Amphidinium_carterae.1